jgi:hypothetical protein
MLQLSDVDLYNKIYAKHSLNSGVYKIISIVDGHRMPIQRLLGIDLKGVLYIGGSLCLVNRITTFKKTISTSFKSNNHSGGRRYIKNEKIVKAFPYNSLYVEMTQHDYPTEIEKQLLDEYFWVFGEAPPLNANC